MSEKTVMTPDLDDKFVADMQQPIENDGITTKTTKPDQSLDDLVAHLNTTDAEKDPHHANSIMKMAAHAIEKLNERISDARVQGYKQGANDFYGRPI